MRLTPLMAMVHPEDRSEVRGMQAGLFQNATPVSDFEVRLIDKEGRVKWVRAKASLTDWLGQQAAVTFMDDVTAQVQAEAALKQSVDIVNSMFKSVQDAFYMATLKEGRFLELNHAFETLVGYSRDEAIGATSVGLALWVDPAERARMVNVLQAEGHVRNYMTQVRRKDGHVFPCAVSMAACDIDGTACLVGFLRDDTERLAAENAIRESEARYRLLADNIADVIWMADMDSLRFTYASPSCLTARRIHAGGTGGHLHRRPGFTRHAGGTPPALRSIWNSSSRRTPSRSSTTRPTWRSCTRTARRAGWRSAPASSAIRPPGGWR